MMMKDKIQIQWQKIKEWWAPLATREKQAIAIGGTIAGIFILYQFIWSPFVTHLDVMRKRIQSDGKNLIWMQAADAKIKKIENLAKENNVVTTPVGLMSALQKQIEREGLAQYLGQIKQASETSVEVHFNKVVFDKLVSFLTVLIRENHVVIGQFTATADAAPGVVSADIVLKI